MKKSRIFMAAGTLVLAVTAIFATKANKKFTNGFTTVTIAAGSYTVSAIATSAIFTTVSSGLVSKQLYANFYTSANGGTTFHSVLAGPMDELGKPTYIK